MLTFLCVLKSGGDYDASWVEKLQNGVKRNYTRPHKFVCLSDVPVPCERIPLKHGWPGWWSKIELFSLPNEKDGYCYLDLDTVVTSSLDELVKVELDFGMLQNFNNPEMVGSGVMWMQKVPHHIYHKFAKQPDAWIAHHERNRDGTYLGDQAFIWDCMKHEVPRINDHFKGIKSYKYHCRKFLPEDARIVCFGGLPKLNDVKEEWIKEHWDGAHNLCAA